MGIASAWQLLRAGNQLRKPQTWRDRDASAQALTPILLMAGTWAYAKGWLPAEITAEDALYWAVGIATAVQWVSSWINRASTADAGWGQRKWRQREGRGGYGDDREVYQRVPYAGPGHDADLPSDAHEWMLPGPMHGPGSANPEPGSYPGDDANIGNLPGRS